MVPDVESQIIVLVRDKITIRLTSRIIDRIDRISLGRNETDTVAGIVIIRCQTVSSQAQRGSVTRLIRAARPL